MHLTKTRCSSGCTFNTTSVDVSRRIDVHKREHLELLGKSCSVKTHPYRFLYRRTVGTENLVPQWPIGKVAPVDLALMVKNVFLGPLNEIANPVRCPYVPVREQCDEELEDTDDGDRTRIEP